MLRRFRDLRRFQHPLTVSADFLLRIDVTDFEIWNGLRKGFEQMLRWIGRCQVNQFASMRKRDRDGSGDGRLADATL